MKKRVLKLIALITVMSFFITPAYAVAPGFYLGLMTGPGKNNASETKAQIGMGVGNTTLAKPKSTLFGTRFFLGYKINQ